MGFDLAFSIKVFSALFAIMNPVVNVPIFLALTDGATPAQRRRVARTAMVTVAIGCVLSAVAGAQVLALFGVNINDFRLAGGLLVLLIALSMLHGAPNAQHASTAQERADVDRADSVAIYPLAIPMLLGPGSIATMIVMGHGAMANGHELAFAAGLLAFLALLAVALLAAPSLARHLSPRVAAITQRLMGMILAAIAVDMMLTSLRAVFPALTR